MDMKRGVSVRGLSVTVFVLISAIGLALLYAASAEARPALHPCPGNEGQIVESGFLHDLNCGAHTPTSTPTDTPTSTDTPTDTATPTDTPTDTATPTDTPTSTSTSTSTPTPTGALPTNTPTPTPTGRTVPANTPTPTPTGRTVPANTPTPTPTGRTVPATAPTSTPTGRTQPATAPTSTPTPAGGTLPTDAPTEMQGAESFYLQSPCIVAHAATPAQLCLTTAGIEYYFIGPDGVATGPLLPTMSELAQTHTAVSPVVELYSGANPLSGKSVQVDYLPNEKVIRVSTYYADTPYSIDKPYIFTLNESYQVTHLAW